MAKSKTIERLLRFLITLAGAGLGAVAAALFLPFLRRTYPLFFAAPYGLAVVYLVLCALFALPMFLFSHRIMQRLLQLTAAVERRWAVMPTQQIMLASLGLIGGLVVAALFNQLLLSAGANLLTISLSAILYLLLGTLGLQIGYRQYHEHKKERRHFRMKSHRGDSLAGVLESAETLFGGDDEAEDDDTDTLETAGTRNPPKLLDTSVIIDGRIFDIAKTGFLEGDIVIPQFVLAELRHIADSGDSLRRARGRRGLDVLAKLQTELKCQVVISEADYTDVTEVDVKLLRLCRDLGGVVVTNDYNLNKVAGVSGIRVLNINDLANAIKPMLAAGEELTVQIMREGKEPGQGVAYLDDGTMIVVDNGRRFVGENVTAVVTTVLQTSAGRMIFAKIKTEEPARDE
jgi:uncharacterized protein YacL